MIDGGTPCVAVLVMDETDEEVARFKVPGMRQFGYVSQFPGWERLHIVPAWGSDWREESVDIYGPWLSDPGQVYWYHPPSVRAKWGDIQ
jgi:hypothetical protein